MDYLGRGTLFKAYIPEGWDCRVFDDDQAFSRLAAVCKGLRLAEQAQLQGAQQRQQNAFAASQRLRQTMNETSDIINSGYRQRSATIDNVYRKASEAVRGVNTYTDSYGRDVEADVRYERVFQRGSDYAGTTSAGVDPGADWQELKRRD